jgi:hypothetical protein
MMRQTHFVTFDGVGKIAQIRQQWDQGSLLKQLDIIGKTGRNWPIKDSRDQLVLIQSSLKASGAITRSQTHNEEVTRARGSSTNVLRDPHATLHMMGTREELENSQPESTSLPYAGMKTTQRGFTDILGDDPAGEHYEDRLNHQRSPSKLAQNFQPMRIFEAQEEGAAQEDDNTEENNRQSYIKPNPRKYQHFDFVDGSDPADAPEAGVSFDEQPKTKRDSQWSFGDFYTPSKPKPSKTVRTQQVRHWDTDKDALGEKTPAPVGKARRDAETHFELQDDGERLERQDRPGQRQRGAAHNDGLGLYKNKLFEQGDETPGPKRALGNITNLGGRGKDFDAHWEMTDDAQTPQPVQGANANQKKVLKNMDANWSSYDESPKLKENANTERLAKGKNDTGINIAGDGMGGRKGTNRDWLYGGGEEEETAPKPTTTRRNPNAQTGSFWE